MTDWAAWESYAESAPEREGGGGKVMGNPQGNPLLRRLDWFEAVREGDRCGADGRPERARRWLARSEASPVCLQPDYPLCFLRSSTPSPVEHRALI